MTLAEEKFGDSKLLTPSQLVSSLVHYNDSLKVVRGEPFLLNFLTYNLLRYREVMI